MFVPCLVGWNSIDVLSTDFLTLTFTILGVDGRGQAVKELDTLTLVTWGELRVVSQRIRDSQDQVKWWCDPRLASQKRICTRHPCEVVKHFWCVVLLYRYVQKHVSNAHRVFHLEICSTHGIRGIIFSLQDGDTVRISVASYRTSIPVLEQIQRSMMYRVV